MSTAAIRVACILALCVVPARSNAGLGDSIRTLRRVVRHKVQDLKQAIAEKTFGPTRGRTVQRVHFLTRPASRSDTAGRKARQHSVKEAFDGR